jgi:thioredoxin 1
VDRILLQLDSVLHPQCIVLGGSAVREAGATRLIELLTVTERIPGGIVPASLGLLGGVKGAAWGAAREFRTRDALAAVRKAVGASAKTSAQALSISQLRAVFDQFAASSAGAAAAGAAGAPPGSLSCTAMGDMLRALAVDVAGDAELKRIFTALDVDASGGITWAEWSDWWAANVASEPVQLILSSGELEGVLAEEPKDKLICLEVGMTFCRPCKAFEKTYKGVAAEYPEVKFLRLNGNENRSCTALARDTLGLRSTPAFYFFRAGSAGIVPVASHTGANEPRLRKALQKLTAPGAADAAPAASDDAAAAAAVAPAAPKPKPDSSKSRHERRQGLRPGGPSSWRRRRRGVQKRTPR